MNSNATIIWSQEKEKDPNIIQKALKENLFTSKWFWIFTLLVAGYLYVFAQLKFFDRLLGLVFMLLGVSSFNISVRNRINEANVVYALTDSHVYIENHFPTQKVKEVPYEDIVGYEIKDNDVVFHIRNSKEFLNRWKLYDSVTFKNVKVDEELLGLLAEKIK